MVRSPSIVVVVAFLLTAAGQSGPLPEFSFRSVALHPDDLSYAPTGQLIHPTIISTVDRIEKPLGKYYLYYAPFDVGHLFGFAGRRCFWARQVSVRVGEFGWLLTRDLLVEEQLCFEVAGDMRVHVPEGGDALGQADCFERVDRSGDLSGDAGAHVVFEPLRDETVEAKICAEAQERVLLAPHGFFFARAVHGVPVVRRVR